MAQVWASPLRGAKVMPQQLEVLVGCLQVVLASLRVQKLLLISFNLASRMACLVTERMASR